VCASRDGIERGNFARSLRTNCVAFSWKASGVLYDQATFFVRHRLFDGRSEIFRGQFGTPRSATVNAIGRDRVFRGALQSSFDRRDVELCHLKIRRHDWTLGWRNHLECAFFTNLLSSETVVYGACSIQ
jgi:hypothetical protein